MSGVQISKGCIVVAPASPNVNVVFGLHAWVWWTNKSNPERRGKLHRLSFNIEVLGVRFYLVNVCRVWFVCPSTVVSTVVPTTSLPRSPFGSASFHPSGRGSGQKFETEPVHSRRQGPFHAARGIERNGVFPPITLRYGCVWVYLKPMEPQISVYIYVCVWHIHMFSINHLSIGAPNFDPYPAWWMVGKWFVFSWDTGGEAFHPLLKMSNYSKLWLDVFGWVWLNVPSPKFGRRKHPKITVFQCGF